MSHLKLVVTAVLAATPLIAVPVAAQGSASGSIEASLTVVAEISVAPAQPIQFGTHFPSAGSVVGGDGEWFINGAAGTTVDVSLDLPGNLFEPGGSFIPLTWGTTSLTLWCDDGAGNITATIANPETGSSGCLLPEGGALIELGNGLGADGNVTALVSGNPPGVYTAVIELTAIVN